MISKSIFTFVLFNFCKITPSEASFAIVVDTTVSMKEEIDVLKNNIGSVFRAIENSDFADDHFVIVPFNDDVQTPEVSTSPEDFKNKIDRLYVSGGHECPENSLAGIQRALEVSEVDSQIFVFTDAYANDISKVDAIKDLCHRTRSQVVIFLSGSCVPHGTEDAGNVEVYGDITSSCSGMLFQFDSSNLKQAFKYMQEILTDDWSDVATEGSFPGSRQIMFPVTSYTKGLMIAVSGDYPTMEVTDPDGNRAECTRVVNTRHVLVWKILNLKHGEYKIDVRGIGQTTGSLTIYSQKEFPFEIGFSTRIPRNMRETSRRPIPGTTNYILITISEINDVKLNSIELSNMRESNNFTLNMHQTNDGRKTYITKCLFHPHTPFRITVFGVNEYESKEFFETSGTLEPQNNVISPQWTSPKVEILDRDMVVEYGTNVVLSCKVVGYPQPTIWWSNGSVLDNFESFLLEIPSVYITYFSLTNVTTNGTYYCEAENAKGQDANRIQLYVHRSFVFRVIQKPEDTVIEYSKEGEIFCKINAYPEATVKWYHNGTHIEYADNIEVKHDGQALFIKNMGINDVGQYTCEVKNSIETKSFSAEVTISGIESPLVDTSNTPSEINIKPGVTTNLDCRIAQGKPTPKIKWKFQADGYSYFSDIPYDIHVKGERLQFTDAKPEYKGIYRCEASNVVGTDFRNFTINVQYPPLIDNNEETSLPVREGSPVELPCQVKSDPVASVRWELSQNGVIVPLGDRFKFDDDHTLRFKSLLNDSGEYHCIAENEIGTTEKILKLIVLELPSVDKSSTPSDITLKPGFTNYLDCRVTKGIPKPQINWKFQPDGTSYFNDVPYDIYLEEGRLQFPDVKLEQKGVYRCEASNDAGSDYRDFTVNVQLPPFIENNEKMSLSAKEGSPVELPCQVTSDPVASVRWEFTKSGVVIPFDNRFTIDDDHTIRFNSLWKDSGEYHCIAENEIGRTQKIINLNVLVAPYIQGPQINPLLVKAGDSVNLPCVVQYGNPPPTTVWDFTAKNDSNTIMRNTKSNSLHLDNVTTSNEGVYTCVATNKVGIDRIKIHLKVV